MRDSIEIHQASIAEKFFFHKKESEHCVQLAASPQSPRVRCPKIVNDALTQGSRGKRLSFVNESSLRIGLKGRKYNLRTKK